MHPVLDRMDTMLNDSDSEGPTRQALSVLMDSELAPDQLPGVVAGWQQDPEQRATWHCYHLIGDVLRSQDLARPAQRDEALLRSLRTRLAGEPAPLAPRALPDLPMAAAGPQRRVASPRLVASAAMVAGFVVVAGLMVVLRSGAPAAADPGQLAQATAPQAGALALQVSHAQAGALVRNAGLDRYLEAHRKLGNSVAAAGAAEQRVPIVYESK